MTEASPPLIFLDANVLIEALIGLLPAQAVMDLAAGGSIRLMTCRLVVDAVENDILRRAQEEPAAIDELVESWRQLLDTVPLMVVPDPPRELVESAKQRYLPTMRHLPDIPVLASALEQKADLILSGNREHFNDATAGRAGIQMYSCAEFLRKLVAGP
ncbi:MAG TPA: type II toxin-antitoxin system VapC family toxin [Candidatus Obscuribacterales bacterium]